jgi:hypothetical protein
MQIRILSILFAAFCLGMFGCSNEEDGGGGGSSGGGGTPSSVYAASDAWFTDLATNTGVATPVGSPGTTLRGLAYDSVNDVLYGSDSNSLYTVNKTNGAPTLVGNHTPYINVHCLAYDTTSGTLWGIAAGRLLSINVNTAVQTEIGQINVGAASGFEGMAYNPNINVLYAIGSTSYVQPQLLISINKSTGAGAVVGNTTGATALLGLAYDATTDSLYSVNNANSVGNSETMFRVDMFNGTATPIGTGTGVTTMRSLAPKN